MYGQQLKDEFEARTGELWPLNVGQVYTSLSRLERDGLVHVVSSSSGAVESGRQLYELTAGGEIELDLWLKAPASQKNPPRDELVMKIMIAISIDQASSVEVVQSHRRLLLESMRQYTHIKAGPTISDAALMMCDAEIYRLEAAVRWLDSVDAHFPSPSLRDQTLPASPSVPARADS